MAEKEKFHGYTYEELAAIPTQQRIELIATFPESAQAAIKAEHIRRANKLEEDKQQGAVDRQEEAQNLDMQLTLASPFLAIGAKEAVPGAIKGIGSLFSGSTLPTSYAADALAAGATEAAAGSVAGSGALGVGAGGVAPATTTATSGSGIAGALGGALPAAGLAAMAGLYANTGLNAYNELTGDDQGGKTTGAVKAGLLASGIGAPFAIGADLLGLGFKSGKDPEQLERDVVRTLMQERGLADQNYQTASGYDVGRETRDDGTQIFDYYGEDGQTPLASLGDPNAVHQAVGTAAPIAGLLTGFDPRASHHAQGLLAGDFLGGGSSQDAYKSLGYEGLSGRDKAYTEVLNAQGLDPNKRNAMLAQIDKDFGVVNPNAGKGGVEEYGDVYIPEDEEKKKKTEAAKYIASGLLR